MKILYKRYLILSLLLLLVAPSLHANETGIGCWYGKVFHGRKTASGERYDMYGYTAAHRTLPFNTIVKVTNLQNKRSVKVRITDRGPYTRNRIIDLSYAAAKKLGFIKKGIAKLEVQVVRQ